MSSLTPPPYSETNSANGDLVSSIRNLSEKTKELEEQFSNLLVKLSTTEDRDKAVFTEAESCRDVRISIVPKKFT